jgi:hypothetical protein
MNAFAGKNCLLLLSAVSYPPAIHAWHRHLHSNTAAAAAAAVQEQQCKHVSRGTSTLAAAATSTAQHHFAAWRTPIHSTLHAYRVWQHVNR